MPVAPAFTIHVPSVAAVTAGHRGPTFLSSLVLASLWVPLAEAAAVIAIQAAPLPGGRDKGTRAVGHSLSQRALCCSAAALCCIYNPELACERRFSLAGLLFPHEGSSPEVCGHQSKLTGHCFFSMTTPAPPNGDRCPASDARLWRALLLGKKGRKMGAL